jgi:steroid delta-isomerase
MPTPEDIRQVYDRYFTALVEHDIDGVMAMFAADAVLHDPVDGPVREGIEAIREYYGGGLDAVQVCRLAGPVHISADCHHAAISGYTEADLGYGMVIWEAIDVMTFSDDGKVATMTTYWGPTNIRPA